MASKKIMQRRISLAALDMRQMKLCVLQNDWQGAMDWLNDLTGDVEVVREYIQARLDGQDNADT